LRRRRYACAHNRNDSLKLGEGKQGIHVATAPIVPAQPWLLKNRWLTQKAPSAGKLSGGSSGAEQMGVLIAELRQSLSTL
jgi:hypothetical protein